MAEQNGAKGYYTIAALLLPIYISAAALFIIAKYIAVYVETHEPGPGVPHIDQEEYEEHVRANYDSKKHYAKPISTALSLMLLVIGALVLAEYFLIFSITR